MASMRGALQRGVRGGVWTAKSAKSTARWGRDESPALGVSGAGPFCAFYAFFAVRSIPLIGAEDDRKEGKKMAGTKMGVVVSSCFCPTCFCLEIRV